MDEHRPQSLSANASLKTASIVLYGTFAALLLILPAPVADWCDDHADWAVIRAAGAVAHAVNEVSHRLHVADAFEAARQRFSALIER
ncbi:MAG: hypothetical protein P4L82_12735 [Ancalomicrobiaceae bacterium]|nr:hypothetical protein [Ancalomicrobiaceae bacterium]